ncbi:Leucine Rich repeat, putative [Leishmania guyanensis]
MDSAMSKPFGSVRSTHSYDRVVRSSRQASSSFVTINQKRLWRPSSSLFQPILDYMPNAAPFALAAANPFLRLFVERNVEGGGFVMRDYQVTPLLLGKNGCGCGGACGADALARESSRGAVNGSLFGGCDARRNHMAAEYSGLGAGTSGMVVEDDGVIEAWDDEEGDGEGFREDNSEPQLGTSIRLARVIPFHISGIGTLQGLSPLCNHFYPCVGAHRSVPSTAQAVSFSLKSNAAAAADMHDRGCLLECWQSAALELSMCVSVTCTSDAALYFATLGAWWLSRYYGVSLRLHHAHPAQVATFKAAQRALSLKEIQLENCIVSEDLLQCISTCADLLSLSIISCSASQQITLQCINSILRKGSGMRPAGFSNTYDTSSDVDATDGTGKQDMRQGFATSRRNGSLAKRMSTDSGRDGKSWYLSGIRSLGSLKQLRCLHILHTPLHETFLQALTTCSSLECLILHRCRGVRSLEPLRRLRQLQSLSLHGLSVTDTGLLPLTSCTQLRQLVLDECRQITDLSFLANLRGTLERLLMPRTLLSNANMQHIGLCDKLVELHLQSLRQLTDIGGLKNLTALRVLNLRDNLVTDEGCSALYCMPSLQLLNLASCRCITSLAAALSTSGRWTQRLLSLDLSQTNITDSGLRCIQQCTSLRYLNLCGCSELRLLHWLKKMYSLRWLHLGGTYITDEETKRYLPYARNLRFLSLSGCSNVRSLTFAGKLLQLEYLYLDSTGVADNDLSYLCWCRKLRYLSLQSCAHIRDVSLLGALPALLELNVSLTAVGSSVGSALSTTSGGSDGRSTPHGSSALLCSVVSPVSAGCSSSPSSIGSTPALPLSVGASCFPVVQVLHMNGCSRISRLEELTKCYPQLRVLYADRISVMPPPSIGFGFIGMDERRRLGTTVRSRGLLQHRRSMSISTDEADSESPPAANRSVMHLGEAHQQYVPQPPVALRPSTAHAVASRHNPHHCGSPCGNKPQVKSRSVSLHPPGRSARVIQLMLRRSSLTDMMLEQLCVTFDCVSSLDLTKCTEVQCLSGLEKLYALRELILTQSSVGNDGVRVISACDTLEVLRLTECRSVTDVCSLGNLRKLRVLCLARTQLTNQGLEGIGRCLALQYLNCAECRYLSDVNALGSLKHLIELHLERTDVDGAGIAGVMRCSSLQRVYFTRCQRLTTIGDVRASLPQLEVLDVYGTSIPTRVAGQGQQFACAAM